MRNARGRAAAGSGRMIHLPGEPRMKLPFMAGRGLALGLSIVVLCALAPSGRAQVRAWEGTLTLPTYPWEGDANPRFWALEPGARGAIVYPYTMQDHLSRTKTERTYRALFVENEFLKVTCLPELGGRIHSVLDKTQGQEMFHCNRVIKPSMIAMRGAWISGGIEWNAGPQGHTVTCLSPVDALAGTNPDGSAYLEISNLERSRRTRWTVRLTLHPGKACLDEQISLCNLCDTLSPYYFWNCTAYPCRAGTRFIFPMSLGTDHARTKFFNWPINEGKDLSWLKNYDRSSSIFAVDCTFDFFGAYDVDADRGIVQAADHSELGGKKAWTWGTWEFGLVCEQNLTDEDGPYIEVQSGPLPTQSDYGALWPHDAVTWQEWWYPVHGLGDGFEFANRDVAVQTRRTGGGLELRILATSNMPGATCTILDEGSKASDRRIDLSPQAPAVLLFSPAPSPPVQIAIRTAEGASLASFVSPLAIPVVNPPPDSAAASPASPSAEQHYRDGRKAYLAADRAKARACYEEALAVDAGHVAALRGLAVLDIEAGRYHEALPRLEQALGREPTDGLSWYFLGAAWLKLGEPDQALRCGQRAAHCRETASLGYDLAGRAYMRLQRYVESVEAFKQAAALNPRDTLAQDHLLIALRASGRTAEAVQQARERLSRRPTDLVLRAIAALHDAEALDQFARDVQAFAGEVDYEVIETSLVFADLGQVSDAARLLSAVCSASRSSPDRHVLPMYYLAWLTGLQGDEAGARAWLAEAAPLYIDGEFEARPEAATALEYAVGAQPDDAHAHLHLGNVYAALGRTDEAVAHWKQAAELNPSLSVALRNLGLYSQNVEHDLTKAAEYYRQARAARPTDQTLYRDLAKILVADGQRDKAITVLELLPSEPRRRTDVVLTLAELYVDAARFGAAVDLLEATPYFVNWEGDSLPWLLFYRAHVGRGEQRLQNHEHEAALRDFDAALTYPQNLGVGRSPDHELAAAQYGRGQALAGLGHVDEARAAWQAGAAQAEGSETQNKYRELCRAAAANEQ